MLNWFVTPMQVPNIQLPSEHRELPVLAQPMQRRNGLWQLVPGAETAKTVVSLALANGGSATLWTAGAGNAIYLTHLSVTFGTTGRGDIQYNGVAIWSGLLTANQPFAFPISGLGMFLYPAAASLVILNNTGGAANVFAAAWGAEVTA